MSGDLFPDAPEQRRPITLADQIAEVERELALRRRTYPKWILSGRLFEFDADRQMAVMEAVLTTLVGLR